MSGLRYRPFQRVIATIKFRRGGDWRVKPEYERADGCRGLFLAGGIITSDETSIYAGEQSFTMLDGAVWLPAWAAAGDLVDIVTVQR